MQYICISGSGIYNQTGKQGAWFCGLLRFKADCPCSQAVSDRGKGKVYKMWVIAGGFMAVCSVIDIRKKEIPLPLIGFFAAAALACSAVLGAGGWKAFLLSLIPGSCLLLLGLCTRESIGYGDGLLVLVLGIILGLEKCLMTVGAGLAASSAYALVLLVLRKANGRSRLPFVPFLTAGLGVTFIVWSKM